MGICYSGNRGKKKEDVTRSSSATAGGSKITGDSDPSSASNKGKKRTSGNFTTQRAEHDILSSPDLKVFTYDELSIATRNFRPDWLIGEGGFGCVYKGWINEQTLMPEETDSGLPIAVKTLKPEGWQGHPEWLSEVDMLGQLHHPNVVKLIGFCKEGINRLLIYEYMHKGSLENNLFTRRGFALSWEIRIKIAIDAARGLAFLHSPEQPIIFRDFKTSNVLLDSEYNAKLSDFGYAKVGPTDDHSHVSTRVIGTSGYCDPEYLATGHLTAKCDVYSFGVVLFELLTGRRVLDKRRPGENLLRWVIQYLGDIRWISGMMDMKLMDHYPKKAAYMVARLAARCTGASNKRPTMVEVIEFLDKLPAADSSPQSSPQPGSQSSASPIVSQL